jgi:SAM-dependent methyltransferase
MDEALREKLGAAAYRRSDFAADYDRHRPRPPAALLELLPQLAGVDRPQLVVDLGSGSGLSTRFWAGAAAEVVGVEMNDAMREFAEQATTAPNVRYVSGLAHETGLPDGSADLVTAAQSLQWMELDRVVPEIARILRHGGVFCAYNYFRLQTPDWDSTMAFDGYHGPLGALVRERGLERPVLPAEPEKLGAGRHFRIVRDTVLHSVEEGDGERLLGFALSEGNVRVLLEEGVSEEEIGIDRLRRACAEVREPVPWWVGYRVWLCLK